MTAPASAAPTWLAPQPISAAGQDATAPRVATDAQGNVIAVWQRRDGANDRIEAAHRPAGGGFAAAQPISAAGRDAEAPHLAIDTQGNAIAVWQRRDGANRRIEAAFRPAGGAFGEPQLLSAAGENAEYPQVAFDPQGNAIAAWQRFDGANWLIEAAFRPAGGSFEPPQPISAAGQDAQELHFAIDPQGNAIAVWQRFDGANDRIEAAFRPAGGSFEPPQPISAVGQDAFAPRVATDPQGNAIAVWQRFDGANDRIEAAFRPAGGGFAAAQPISAAGQDAEAPDLAIDTQGNAIAVWRRFDGANRRIEAAFRPAGGAFGEPQLLSAAGENAGFPQVAIDAQGNAIAAWWRFDGAHLRIEAAFRPAGGVFGASQPLSAPGQDADAPRIVPDPEGNAIAVWRRSDGANTRIEAAGFDAAGPQLRNLSIPATAERGMPASFSVSPFDVWSQVASTGWNFGDGRSAQGEAVRHAFAKVGTFQVTVASTDAVGNASSATATVRVRDTIKPRISKLRVTPQAVRPAGKGGRKGARGSAAPKDKRAKAPKAKIRFRLSEPARVTFTVKRQVRKRCGKRRCLKLVAVKGKLTAKGRQGANAVPFKGRVGGRALAPGRYVLTAQARDGAGNRSRPARASFRVAE